MSSLNGKALERGGVEQLGTARPEAACDQSPVRAGGQGRDVRRAGSPQFPAQVMNAGQGTRPRQSRSEVLPGLGGVVGPDALHSEQQPGREVLVQHALSAGATGVRQVGRLRCPVPLTVRPVSRSRAARSAGPYGDQPGDQRQHQQDADAGESAAQPPVDSPLLREPRLGRADLALGEGGGRLEEGRLRCRSGRVRPGPATPGCGRAGRLGRARSRACPWRPRRPRRRPGAGRGAGRRRRRRASRAAAARP